jgi:hypothetical protein
MRDFFGHGRRWKVRGRGKGRRKRERERDNVRIL